MRMLDRLGRVPAWIDCGRSDPFAHMAEKARDRLHPTPEGGMYGGAMTAPMGPGMRRATWLSWAAT